MKTFKTLNYSDLQAELAAYFESIDFTHFCTFTTRKPVSIKSCRRIAVKVGNMLCRLDPSAIMFWASEPFALNQHEVELRNKTDEILYKTGKGQRYHFHALIKFSDCSRNADKISVNRKLLWKWYTQKFGRADLDPIRKEYSRAYNRQAAAMYITKYTTKHKDADYDFHVCPHYAQRYANQ